MFREWHTLQINLRKANSFRDETLLSSAYSAMKHATKQRSRKRELGKVCQMHYTEKMRRKILVTWNQYAHETKHDRDARFEKMAYMRGYRMARIIKAWFNTIDLLKNKEQITNHALNSRVFRIKK